MDLTTQLRQAGRPRDVLRAAGAVIADELGKAAEFHWLRSKERLERRIGDRTEQIALQNSQYNRVGGPLDISLHLLVCDATLRAWRAGHADIALYDDDILIAQPLGYVAGREHGRVYGSWDDGVLDLAEPSQRAARVAATIGMLRNSILPWFAETADPETLVTRAPTATISMSASRIIEWLACLGRHDLIEPLVARLLDNNPKLGEGIDRGRRLARHGQRPSGGDMAEQIGWAAAWHGGRCRGE